MEQSGPLGPQRGMGAADFPLSVCLSLKGVGSPGAPLSALMLAPALVPGPPPPTRRPVRMSDGGAPPQALSPRPVPAH